MDEVFSEIDLSRPFYKRLVNFFSKFDSPEFDVIQEYSKNTFFSQGITFNVYNNREGQEKIFPFDLFPRLIQKKEWETIEQGVIQRNQTLNAFLYDLYHDQKILKDKIIPKELVDSSDFYCEEMEGFDPIGKIYSHICGTDLIRHKDGKFYVLEDNIRVPSGISYVLANRATLKKALPNLFSNHKVLAVDDYPEQLMETMYSVAPENMDDPTCVLLTPGRFNSAYYEHIFLSSQMGIQMVEGRDLYVENNFVYMQTIYGPKRVDVIYRRIDDAFLDPMVFRKDSLLGVKGLMEAYKKGNVTLINAPGTGVADDKAIYSYVPEMIRYYLDQDPILNNVKTYRCVHESDCKYVIENLDNLVVKPVDESGGYGIIIGNKATKEEKDAYKKRIQKNPRKYIAQPIMSLSLHSTFIEEESQFEPRHIDLRIFSLYGKNEPYVCKGGLTRVALRKNNLIVNSSQGGGSKDTWVLGK